MSACTIIAFSVAPRRGRADVVAVRVDANRRDEEHIFIHVNAVDLDRQKIKIVKPGFHPRLIRAATTPRSIASHDFDSPLRRKRTSPRNRLNA